MGRSVLKARLARINILTWPSQHHFSCDSKCGMHLLYPLFFAQNLLLFIIFCVISSRKSQLIFISLAIPKILSLIALVFSYVTDLMSRRHLRGWILGKLSGDDDLDNEQKAQLAKVIKKNFNYQG